MSRPGKGPKRLTPKLLLRAYAAGIFPMAESRHADTIFWVDPELRGILPLDTFHVPRSLRKKVSRNVFDVRCDTACEAVIHACSARARDRRESWINDEIIEAYAELHTMGFVHSVETWQDGRLVGVIGYQPLEDVTLLRHLYVETARQRCGLGSALLRHVVGLTATPRLLVGMWAAAAWAVRFYQRHGFSLLPDGDQLLRTYWSIPARQREASLVMGREV